MKKTSYAAPQTEIIKLGTGHSIAEEEVLNLSDATTVEGGGVLNAKPFNDEFSLKTEGEYGIFLTADLDSTKWMDLEKWSQLPTIP